MALLALLLIQQDALRALADEDPDVRDAAMELLLEPALLERALTHRDPEVRARAHAVRRALDPRPPDPARWGVSRGGQPSVSVTSACFGIFRRVEVPSRPDPEAPPTEADLRAWIAGLGAETISERVAATAKLHDAGRYAESALQDAAGSADLEAAIRARCLLAGLRPRTIHVPVVVLPTTSGSRVTTFSRD